MGDEQELRRALQILFERQYLRRQNFNKWAKLLLTVLIPIWVIAFPIALITGLHGIDHGVLLLLGAIDIYFILEKAETRREVDKYRQIEHKIQNATLEAEKAKRRRVRLGDDGEIVYNQPQKKKKRQ